MKKLYFKLSFTFFLFSSAISAQTTISPTWHYLGDATNTDNVADAWVNPAGDAYMVGRITMMPNQPHPDGVMFIKTDTNGQEIWRQYIYGTTTDWGLFPQAVIGDETGNVFVVLNENYRYSGYTNARLLIQKYTPNGELIWSQYHTPLANGPIESVATRSGVYKNGILYLAGSQTSLETITNMDGMIVKIDGASGDLIQKIIFDSQYNSDDIFKDLRVSESGEMWAIGRSRGYMWPGGIYSHYDANVVKYTADGSLAWEHRENGTSNSEDFGINIAVDGDGNCYTSNQLKMLSVNQKKVHVQKIAPSGSVIWTYEYQGSSSEYLYKQPIELLPNGNAVLVTSNANGIVTICLDGMTGSQNWIRNYNRNDMGAANHQRDMMIDEFGNIFITGVSRDNTPLGAGYDMVTLKYTTDGTLEWLSNFNYGNYATMGDEGVGLDKDAAGNLYAIGWTSHGANYNDDFLLLKYGATLSTPQMTSTAIAIFPNPANEQVTISLPQSTASANISVYDMNGRLMINKLFQVSGDELTLPVSDLGAGMYLIAVETERGTETHKLIKR